MSRNAEGDEIIKGCLTTSFNRNFVNLKLKLNHKYYY